MGIIGVVELTQIGLAFVEHPVKQAALEAAAGLRHSIDRLLDTADQRHATIIPLDITCGHVAVDDLPFEKCTLEVSRDKVDTADPAPIACGVRA